MSAHRRRLIGQRTRRKARGWLTGRIHRVAILSRPYGITDDPQWTLVRLSCRLTLAEVRALYPAMSL